MNLSVSSLAWQQHDLESSLETLKKLGVRHIEGVLTKIAKWENLNKTIVSNFCDDIASWSITMPSIQSIFHESGVVTFADEIGVAKHLKKVCGLAHVAKSNILVLGSPGLRKPDTRHCLANSLSFVSSDLARLGINICIEPNSRAYGGDYYHDLGEICEFVRSCGIAGVGAMLDTHNLELEGHEPLDEYLEYMDCIKHVHISAPNLAPISDFSRYKMLAEELRCSYDGLVTYEFLSSNDFESHVSKFVDAFSS